VWIGTVVTVQNLTGGIFILVMVSNAFVTDNSLPQDRIVRLGAIHFCYIIRCIVQLRGRDPDFIGRSDPT
jgi:hypothetical protein